MMGTSTRSVEEVCSVIKNPAARDFAERLIRYARRRKEAEEYVYGLGAGSKARKHSASPRRIPARLPDIEPSPAEMMVLELADA